MSSLLISYLLHQPCVLSQNVLLVSSIVSSTTSSSLPLFCCCSYTATSHSLQIQLPVRACLTNVYMHDAACTGSLSQMICSAAQRLFIYISRFPDRTLNGSEMVRKLFRAIVQNGNNSARSVTFDDRFGNDRARESWCSHTRSGVFGNVGDSSATFHDPIPRMSDLWRIGSVCSVSSEMDRKLFVYCYDFHHDHHGSGTFCHERRPIKGFLFFCVFLNDRGLDRGLIAYV